LTCVTFLSPWRCKYNNNIYKKLLPKSYTIYGSLLMIRYTGDPTVLILFFLMKYFELILKWHSNTVITIGLQSTRPLLTACCIKLRIHIEHVQTFVFVSNLFFFLIPLILAFDQILYPLHIAIKFMRLLCNK